MFEDCFTKYAILFKDVEDATEAEAILTSNDDSSFEPHFSAIIEKFGEGLECQKETTYSDVDVWITNGVLLRFPARAKLTQDSGIITAFKTKYPDCEVFYQNDIPDGVFCTNDFDLIFFRDLYRVNIASIDADISRFEYFRNAGEVVERFNNLFGFHCESLEEVNAKAEMINERSDYDYFIITPLLFEDDCDLYDINGNWVR